ncbi:MAG: translocation protein TolB [Myxococcaceae bacterium]
MRTLVLSLLICPLAALAQAPVIEISGANFRPMPIALPAPQALNDAARTLSPDFDDAFFFDCSAAGIFQVLDRKSYLADAREGFTASTITFSRWADVGAEALVKVQLSVDGRDVRGEMRLFTVSSGKEDLRLVHVEPVDRPRRLAHFFADALYKHFTREPGPFQSHLAYVRKVGANKDVFLGDWDGKRALPVAQGNINLLPVVGPQGDSVAYTSYRSGHPALYLQRPGGAPVTLVSTVAMVTGASFSPDGRRLAYSMAQGEGAQIYVADANGANPQPLTDTPYFINSSPTWSPDGKRIAFVSTRGGTPQLYVLTVANAADVRRLTFQGNYNQTPDWSPRGDLIAFTARDERNAFDLFTVNVETGKVNRLTQDQGNNQEPSFSPNGRLVVFASDRTGSSMLWVMTAEGQNQKMLPLDKGNYSTPDWGP